MMLLESGITEKWKKKYWKADNKCTRATDVVAPLENTVGAFVVLVVGVTVAMATIMIEFILNHSLQKCRHLYTKDLCVAESKFWNYNHLCEY